MHAHTCAVMWSRDHSRVKALLFLPLLQAPRLPAPHHATTSTDPHPLFYTEIVSELPALASDFENQIPFLLQEKP